MIFRRKNADGQVAEQAYADKSYDGYDGSAAPEGGYTEPTHDQFNDEGVLSAGGYAEDTGGDVEAMEGGYVPYADVAPHLQELARLQAERGALIEWCLYARDRVNSPAAAERIDAGLEALGITPLRPDGQPFDPALHEAAASVPTADPTLHGTVAETEVPGYADRGRVVRPPVVAVYRQEQA